MMIGASGRGRDADQTNEGCKGKRQKTKEQLFSFFPSDKSKRETSNGERERKKEKRKHKTNKKKEQKTKNIRSLTNEELILKNKKIHI